MIKYSISLIAFSLIVFFASYGVFHFFNLPWKTINTIWIIYYPLLNIGAHYLLVTIKEKYKDLFIMALMAIMGGKMILSLIVLVIYVKLFPEDKLQAGLHFSILYLLFLAYEIKAFLKFQKETEEKNS